MPRDQRPKNPRPMRLTERDFDLLRVVYEGRVLTTQQLQALFFPSRHQAYARLARLYQHGFLARQFLGLHLDKNNTPILYLLDQRGAAALHAAGESGIRWKRADSRLSTLFLQHTLAINTVRVAITCACQQKGYGVEEWRGETHLKRAYDRVTITDGQGQPLTISLIPDSYFVLKTPRGLAHFCLELDRGTMTTQRFQQKIRAYLKYYQSGAYERRYHTKSLRVLTITTSPARADHLRQVTEAAGGKERFWFTTFDQVTADSVLTQPIWQVATQPDLTALFTA